VKVNDCLKNYEGNPDEYEMELKTINFLDTYNKVLKIEPEDVEEPAAVE